MSAPPLLIIGNKNYSSWSLRPWLYLKVAGIGFEERVLPLRTDTYRGAIGRFSPSGKVPALVHGDVQVWDSLAICEYANETWHGGRGWPHDAAARAWARSAVAEMHSGFTDLRGQCSMNVRRIMEQPLPLSRGSAADAQRVQALWREARERFGSGGDFLFGRFGIADAFFAPVVFRFRTYRIAADAEAQRYMQAVLELPATRAWIADSEREPERLADTDQIGSAT